MSNVNVLAAAEYVVANRISARTQKPILYTILYYTQKECWAQYGEKAFEATFYKPQMGSFPVCEEVDEKFKKQPTKEQLVNALREFSGLPQELKLPSAPFPLPPGFRYDIIMPSY